MDTAKLFMSGRSQAVRLPKEFRFDGEEVFVKKVGEAVVLLPREDSWRTLYESLDLFSEDFMEERAQPAVEDAREPLFDWSFVGFFTLMASTGCLMILEGCRAL